MGRLTLNPVSHIDPVGSLLLPGMLLLTSAGFLFGWAKPVPVNGARLRNPRRDMMVVAIAGPFSNLIMLLVLGIFSKNMPGSGWCIEFTDVFYFSYGCSGHSDKFNVNDVEFITYSPPVRWKPGCRRAFACPSSYYV